VAAGPKRGVRSGSRPDAGAGALHLQRRGICATARAQSPATHSAPLSGPGARQQTHHVAASTLSSVAAYKAST